ncbi:MAG TPA: hypothetical protein VEJ18_00250 [Planctomycetota bacterium]|nr:hypothetical protein [Planctomycetota bacterium]
MNALACALLCAAFDGHPADDLLARMKDAASPREKAAVLRRVAAAEPQDAELAAAVARFLTPCRGDAQALVPVAAVDALATFRGQPAAARALLAARARFRDFPYLADRILRALADVGHPLGLQAVEDALAEDPPASPELLARFPGDLAVPALFRALEPLERRLALASAEEKPAIEPRHAEILRVLKQVCGESYPTLKELRLWWERRGAAFREAAARREAERPRPVLPDPPPPPLLVELLFRENQGLFTLNTGASGGTAARARLTGSKPAWTTVVPPHGGPAALAWDAAGGPHAVDLAAAPALRDLRSFTIAGWICVNDPADLPAPRGLGAGQRLLSWLARDGAELVWRADGSLQLGLGQWADASPARSPAGSVPPKNPQAAEPAWRFFAVTYDAGAAAKHVAFYVGSPQTDAALVSAVDYPRGPVGARTAAGLSVGHLPPPLRAVAPDRAFRGLIDELRIFGSADDGSGALGRDAIVRLQNR